MEALECGNITIFCICNFWPVSLKQVTYNDTYRPAATAQLLLTVHPHPGDAIRSDGVDTRCGPTLLVRIHTVNVNLL